MTLPADQWKRLQKQSAKKLNTLVDKHTGSKLNNKGTYYDGHYYDSEGEKEYAIQLYLRVKGKDIKSWARQVKIDLKVNGCHVTNYYIDFIITHNDGSLELIEYKGFETEHWKIKFALLKALKDELYPGATITLVKHKPKYNIFKKR